MTPRRLRDEQIVCVHDEVGLPRVLPRCNELFG